MQHHNEQVKAGLVEGMVVDCEVVDGEHEYHEAVLRLAQLVVHRARVEAPPAISPDSYGDVEPAFPGRASPQRPLYIAVAAAVRRTLPRERDPEYYGNSSEEWRPYQPQVLEPLAERAARIAGTLGYSARISVLSTSSPETKMPAQQLESQRQQGPSIVLADPWVFDGFPTSRTALERVDRCRRETVRLMVPWSGSDGETARSSHTADDCVIVTSFSTPSPARMMPQVSRARRSSWLATNCSW